MSVVTVESLYNLREGCPMNAFYLSDDLLQRFSFNDRELEDSSAKIF